MAEAPLSRDILTRTLQLATPREYAEAISNPVVRRVAAQTVPEHPKRLELLAKQWIGTVTDNTGEVEVYLITAASESEAFSILEARARPDDAYLVRFGSVADIEEYVKRSNLAAQLPEFIATFQELDARLSRADIADFEELAKSTLGRHVLDMLAYGIQMPPRSMCAS